MIHHTISKLHQWALRKIVRANIIQGPHHSDNLSEILRVIVDECRNEFSEDNAATQYYFLSDHLDRAFYEVNHYAVNLQLDELQTYRENFTDMVHNDEV